MKGLKDGAEDVNVMVLIAKGKTTYTSNIRIS